MAQFFIARAVSERLGDFCVNVDLEVPSESYNLVEPSYDSRLVFDWFVMGFLGRSFTWSIFAPRSK